MVARERNSNENNAHCIYVGVFFRMSHFVFLGYLVSKLILLKVNQNIMIPNFKRMEAKDEIFQIFWSGFNSSK